MREANKSILREGRGVHNMRVVQFVGLLSVYFFFPPPPFFFAILLSSVDKSSFVCKYETQRKS